MGAGQDIIAGELPETAYEGGSCSTAGDIGRVISLSNVLYVCLEGLEDLMSGDVQKAHAALQG